MMLTICDVLQNSYCILRIKIGSLCHDDYARICCGIQRTMSYTMYEEYMCVVPSWSDREIFRRAHAER